jgi:hypothetical protein
MCLVLLRVCSFVTNAYFSVSALSDEALDSMDLDDLKKACRAVGMTDQEMGRKREPGLRDLYRGV